MAPASACMQFATLIAVGLSLWISERKGSHQRSPALLYTGTGLQSMFEFQFPCSRAELVILHSDEARWSTAGTGSYLRAAHPGQPITHCSHRVGKARQ